MPLSLLFCRIECVCVSASLCAGQYDHSLMRVIRWGHRVNRLLRLCGASCRFRAAPVVGSLLSPSCTDPLILALIATRIVDDTRPGGTRPGMIGPTLSIAVTTVQRLARRRRWVSAGAQWSPGFPAAQP